MSFRRIPFQFSSTDPVERQRELEKRFGLPSRNKMYVENANPLSMGSSFRDSGACSSPRLQHRVPIFVEGYDLPNRSSVDSSSVSENKKPNVRVIPIEVEGVGTLPSTRHRTFSGPAGFTKEHNAESMSPKDDTSPLKHSMQDLTKPTKIKVTTGPKVYNIPIKVEGVDSVKKNSEKSPLKDKSVQKVHPKVNGCDESKHAKEAKSSPDQKSEPDISEEEKIKIDINNAMKKIDDVLEELKSYESGVKAFSGTAKDKQYRYLDEMLTRCMLRLDDIDTMGSEKVRSVRKNAVKKVQICIDLLEEKINSMKVNDNIIENKVQNENIVLEEAELKVNRDTTYDLAQVSDLSNYTDKADLKDVEMMDVDNSKTSDSKSLCNTQFESSQDATVNVTEIKASNKLEDKEVDVDMTSQVSKVNDDEMVEATVNLESEDNKPFERSEESVTCKEGSHCNVGEIKAPEKLNDSKANLLNEVEMKEEILQDSNSQNLLEVEVPECSQVSSVGVPSVENSKVKVEGSVSQECDVEMNVVENALNDKAINSDITELETIPIIKSGNSGTNISAGLCETQTDSQHYTSSHKQSNIETVDSK